MGDVQRDREAIVEALMREVMGPAPAGEPIDCSREIEFETYEEFYRPYRQAGSGEEILQIDRPIKRYGVGVLYPPGTLLEEDEDRSPEQEDRLGPDLDEVGNELGSDEIPIVTRGSQAEEVEEHVGEESDDFDLSLANAYRPSAMALTFFAELASGSVIEVHVSGGRYVRKYVKVAGRRKIWWLRKPVSIEATFNGDDIVLHGKCEPAKWSATNLDGLNIRVEVYARRYNEGYLVTVCLVNREMRSAPLDEYCLFQSHFRVKVRHRDGSPGILPYPEISRVGSDPDAESMALLYRRAQTFAVGHGCAADWTVDESGERAVAVAGECFPRFEAPSITPEIRRRDGSVLEVSMAALAGLVPGDDGFEAMATLIDEYEEWIRARREEARALDARYRPIAERHLDECSRVAGRMRKGLDYLRQNDLARRAFQLANYAMLLQQLRQKPGVRKCRLDEAESRVVFDEPIGDPDPRFPPPGRGKWRAFQIGFLLMALESVAEDDSQDRETVDLLWFPTGGGKTEAYLGLAAFAIFLRRLKNPKDAGVHVIMRYTLRLLTAQQFQRASALICAMEYIRRRNVELLGSEPFSIGLWLGGSTTPNTREQARRAYNQMRQRSGRTSNMFVIDRCPWCRAEMGRVVYRGRGRRRSAGVLGYELSGNSVVAKCPDVRCEFSRGLPVYVIDEDIYDRRPCLIIGTVDKFALLAWRADTRVLFGINGKGEREYSPPGLIIQDELHLISGPLGSMVGIYESLIEELCTERQNGRIMRPKIVTSTATIRRYREQIRALYGRRESQLFPPPGLDASDSFFARYARDGDGKLLPGRMYVGILGPGFGSMQTAQVRTLTALLQAPMRLSSSRRDPWWTILTFFNSLRELGTTLSLLQSDIPDYLRAIRRREGLAPDKVRKLRWVLELTGRIRSEEVPAAMAALEVPYRIDTDGNRGPVDVCLASNIIEVGIDIDRLSLMVVVGQPKSTSQYIQVTGRIGRRWWERPGLVVTLYSPAKPRDRSHFERFRSYHERLYGQVEPTSVTPFAPPVLDRALHALMVGYVRQACSVEVVRRPSPCPEEFLERFKSVVLERVATVDPGEKQNVERVFCRRMREWQVKCPTVWTAGPNEDALPLIWPAGAYVPPNVRDFVWPTPTSLRNVDAECQAEITRLYALYALQGEEWGSHA